MEEPFMKLTSIALAIALAAATPALAQSPSLDGKTFEGVFLKRGKTSGDADTLVFKDGRFRSSACDKYGYSDAAYKTTSEGGAVRFEAETESPKFGKLRWNGFVRDGKLDATAVMVRTGGKSTENWVVAGERK
jgi:hypothetical protein